MRQLSVMNKWVLIVITLFVLVLAGLLTSLFIGQEQVDLPAQLNSELTYEQDPSAELPAPEESAPDDNKIELEDPKPFLVDASLGEELFTVVENETSEIAPGVMHQRLRLKGVDRLEDLLQAVEILAIDLGQTGLSMEVVSPGDQVLGMQSVPRIALEQNTQGRHAIAAVNLDFFDMSNGMPRGLQITDGEIITGIRPLLSLLAIMPDGSVVIDQGTVMEAVLVNESDEQLEVDGINKIRNDNYVNHAFMMSDKFSSTTRSVGDGVEVVIAPDKEGEVLQAGSAMTGKIEAVFETPNNEIPPGKFILTAAGDKAKWVKEHVQVGDAVTFQATFKNETIHEAVHVYAGGNHSLAKSLVLHEEIPVWIRNVRTSANMDRHPRTILASRGDYFYVFTFDGRQANYADGISLRDAAEYLKLLGMENVINADGGGSTTLAVLEPDHASYAILNRPSGGALRAVANALLIMNEEE